MTIDNWIGIDEIPSDLLSLLEAADLISFLIGLDSASRRIIGFETYSAQVLVRNPSTSSW